MGDWPVKPRLETPEEALARLDAEELTPGEQARMWERLASPAAPRQRRALVLVFALAATALAALLVLAVRGKHDPPATKAPLANACDVDPNQSELRLGKDCGERAVQVAGDDWRLAAGTEVARVEDGARVVSGRVEFRVRPRKGSQFRVQVSHGEVRVIGTVFAVEERAGRGFVAVTEGVIEFIWSDGSRERVGAGQALHWPRQTKPVAPSPPAPASSAPEKPSTVDAGKSNARPPEDMDRTMERLLQLRSQGRNAEAAELLEKTMGAKELSAAQQERLSYEQGLAVEAGGRSACAHWEKHVKRFGSGRHANALARKLERCRAK
jgi:hypothetical protein